MLCTQDINTQTLSLGVNWFVHTFVQHLEESIFSSKNRLTLQWKRLMTDAYGPPCQKRSHIISCLLQSDEHTQHNTNVPILIFIFWVIKFAYKWHYGTTYKLTNLMHEQGLWWCEVCVGPCFSCILPPRGELENFAQRFFFLQWLYGLCHYITGSK